MQTTAELHKPAGKTIPQRLLSLDVMRGLIMILLAGESCRVYESLNTAVPSGPFSGFIQQFFHHPWHGLRFWDLVQPAFMLMAGAALYISYESKKAKGISWQENLPHVLFRCLKLFLCGTALHCVYAGHMVWELWNVLTQLSFTTLVAYLIIRKSFWFQLLFSIFLLVLTEILYRTVLMPGFDQPFTEFINFAAWFDTVLGQKIDSDGWVAINCIPTAAHTIWGALAGRLLISDRAAPAKVSRLLIAGALSLAIGFALDLTGVTPIIKRISTSSFAFVSGGWVLLILALLYWLIDIRKKNRYAWIFTVIGMNAIFIYLFFEAVGVQWVNKTVSIFTNGITAPLGASASLQEVVAAFTTLFLEWLFCYWLYKKKIFFKL